MALLFIFAIDTSPIMKGGDTDERRYQIRICCNYWNVPG